MKSDGIESDKFFKAISAMAVMFGKDPHAELGKAYWRFLRDLPAERVLPAIVECCHESRFMPTVADIRERAGVRTTEERAIHAWTTAICAVGSLGPYKHVDFADSAINETIRSFGGWVTFCQLFDHGPVDEKWARKDFIAAYKQIAKSNNTDYFRRPLVGLSEVQPTPVFVDCPQSISIADQGRQPLQIESRPSDVETGVKTIEKLLLENRNGEK